MKHIFTPNAPTPGAYSQAVVVGNTMYLSGQTGNDPAHPKQNVVDGGVGPQTKQALENLLAVVVAAGGSVHSIVSLRVYLKESGSVENLQSDWHAYNDAYKTFFSEHGRKDLPARAQVWVSNVPWATEPTVVEIEGIAEFEEGGKKF